MLNNRIGNAYVFVRLFLENYWTDISRGFNVVYTVYDFSCIFYDINQKYMLNSSEVKLNSSM